MSARFSIRDVEKSDLAGVRLITDESGLGVIEDAVGLSVAVDGGGLVVGFIRIVQVTDAENPAADGAYVYPVAVLEAWQRRGVGTALIEHALSRYEELRLVACETSRDFYSRVDFELLSWDEVASSIARDCTQCSLRPSCEPTAFIRSAAESEPSFAAVLQQLWARWQESLATCTHCGTCASRCELFPEGSPGASELAQQGLHLLQELQGTSEDSAEPSVNPSERNASAAETDQTTLRRLVQRFAANNPDTLALVRRCSMCGHCTARCPVGISMPHLVRLWRQLLALGSALDPADLKSVQVDTEWHVFSVYRAVYGIAYPEFVSLESLDAGESGEVDTLFFPGCSLVSYAPELVRSVGGWLTAHGYRWALSDACCGSPLNTHGVPKRAQALKERIAAQCARAGIKQVVTVCAGCGEELAPVLEPQIEIVPLPALMQRAGERCVTEQIIAFFDSCHDRAQTHGAPLRALFEQAPTKAMEHERRDTLCCGAGGGVPSFDPELSDRRAARILQEGCAAGAQTVVVSCPTCAYTFASKRIMGSTAPLPEGVGTAHYLELLFSQPIDWEGVFQRLQAMWTGEYATWVYQQLVE